MCNKEQGFHQSENKTASQQFRDWSETITIESELNFLLAYQQAVGLGYESDFRGMTERQVELAKQYDYFHELKMTENKNGK